jgi:hypothetical protein
MKSDLAADKIAVLVVLSSPLAPTAFCIPHRGQCVDMKNILLLVPDIDLFSLRLFRGWFDHLSFNLLYMNGAEPNPIQSPLPDQQTQP